MSKRDWYYGTLREDFGPLSAGAEVFFRKMILDKPLAAGTCWWVRPRRSERFFSVAESYGGEQLTTLIVKKRNGSTPVQSSGDSTIRLNRELRNFQSKIHSGAQPHPNRPLPSNKHHVAL